ncbi:uncharacterized protein B0H18DRAFT_1044028 [Fomitopsis serialis]|uniref:uncharacterized protein n=1 Tax=Fomitopsis serialis TaxID=139415 RepID=UPI0020089AC3|nr:uncharacterized protein B0H18DRAFT_1044028 [Neoantrodia serialis]KAH9914728.1 hypothetical protein B0H18DRAFT_1044028 [Neoantrodia serialis]
MFAAWVGEHEHDDTKTRYNSFDRSSGKVRYNHISKLSSPNPRSMYSSTSGHHPSVIHLSHHSNLRYDSSIETVNQTESPPYQSVIRPATEPADAARRPLVNYQSPRIDPRSVRAMTKPRCRHLRQDRPGDVPLHLQHVNSWAWLNG